MGRKKSLKPFLAETPERSPILAKNGYILPLTFGRARIIVWDHSPLSVGYHAEFW